MIHCKIIHSCFFATEYIKRRERSHHMPLSAPCLKGYFGQKRVCNHVNESLQSLSGSDEDYLDVSRNEKEIYSYVDFLFKDLRDPSVMSMKDLVAEHALLARLKFRAEECSSRRTIHREECVERTRWNTGHQIAIEWTRYISELAQARMFLLGAEAQSRSSSGSSEDSEDSRSLDSSSQSEGSRSSPVKKSRKKKQVKGSPDNRKEVKGIKELDALLQQFSIGDDSSMDDEDEKRRIDLEEKHAFVYGKLLKFLEKFRVAFHTQNDYAKFLRFYLLWEGVPFTVSQWNKASNDSDYALLTKMDTDRNGWEQIRKKDPWFFALQKDEVEGTVVPYLMKEIKQIQEGYKTVNIRDMLVPLGEGIGGTVARNFDNISFGGQEELEKCFILLMTMNTLPIDKEDSDKKHVYDTVVKSKGSRYPEMFQKRHLDLTETNVLKNNGILAVVLHFSRNHAGSLLHVLGSSFNARRKGANLKKACLDLVKNGVLSNHLYEFEMTDKEIDTVTRMVLSSLSLIHSGTFPWDKVYDKDFMRKLLKTHEPQQATLATLYKVLSRVWDIVYDDSIIWDFCYYVSSIGGGMLE
jgi:hypothetical protein